MLRKSELGVHLPCIYILFFLLLSVGRFKITIKEDSGGAEQKYVSC